MGVGVGREWKVGGGRDCDTLTHHLFLHLTLASSHISRKVHSNIFKSDKMRPLQSLPNLLHLLPVLLLVLSTKRASSSTTLSCFSVGLLDLPTFGFNQEEKQEEEEEKSEVKEGEGRQVSSSF